MMLPWLERITIFPIKSLDGVAVKVARILPSGALAEDRTLALFDADGKVVNGKRTKRIHQIRSKFDMRQRIVDLSAPGVELSQFDLDSDRVGMADWFSEYFGFSVVLKENLDRGFPDDLNSPGPTIVSRQSLEQVRSWYPDLDLASIRQRFRTNLELVTEVPFWEDRLFGEAGTVLMFALGEVHLQGVNPCQRCPVPTRDAQSGEVLAGFQTTFVERRAIELPSWVVRERFNHFYRLAVNTQVTGNQGGKILSLGDRLQIL
jgi:uncharacterized protein